MVWGLKQPQEGTMTSKPTPPRQSGKKRRPARKKDFMEEVRIFDDLPDSAMVSQCTVERLCGCKPTTVWRWVQSGNLPAPIKFGRNNRWRVGELRAFLAGTGAAA